MSQAYIVQALRTASGRRKGALSGWHPADLSAQILDALVARSGIDPAEVEATGTGALPDWQALIEWCQKLQALDVLPFSMAYSILDGWLMGILADQFFWPYTEQLDLFNYHDPETSPDQAGTVSQEEIVYQVLVNGWRPFSEAPMRGYFELLKAFKPYLPIGAETRSIMRYSWDKFMNQQLAMLWEGCWLVRDLAADDLLPFEWGGMWLPPVTRASSPFAPDPAMLPVDVGGYSSAAGINIAAVERGHLQQCIDWLMLTTTPENNSHLVNEVPMLLPSVRGAAIPPEMGKLLGDRLDAPPGVHAWQPPIYWLGSGGHTTFYDVIQREMGLWLLGERSLEQFLATADSELALQSREVLAANAVQYHADGSWDLTRWPKQPPPPSF